MLLDEFLISLGLKVDNSDISKAEKFGDSLDDIKDGADGAESSLIKAYDATDGFVSAIEGALGVLGFFTGVMGTAFAFFHGTIMELEDLIKEEKLLFDVTKEQLGQQKKYVESVETLGKRFNSLKVELAFGFLPTLQRMITGLDNWLAANKDLIVNGITSLLNAISSVFGVIGNFIRFIDLVIENTVGWEKALYILGAALIYINRAMLLAFATNPVFWIIAAIGVLLILIDDFMTYLNGGESEFGEYWGVLLGWIDKAKKAWSEFSEEAKSAIKALIVALGLLASSGIIVKTMTVVFAILGKTIGFILSPVRLLIGLVGTLAKAFLLLGKVILANPIILVVALIAAVGYAIYDLIKWLKTGESAFGGFWQYIADAWNGIVQAVSNAIETIVNTFKAAWNDTKSALSNAVDGMLNSIKAFITNVGAVFSGIFDLITSPFKRAFDYITDKFSKLPGLIKGAISAVGNFVTSSPVVNTINQSSGTAKANAGMSAAASNNSSRVVNNYGGNTTASINMTSPNADIAANRVVSTLKNTQAKSNLGGQALA